MQRVATVGIVEHSNSAVLVSTSASSSHLATYR